MASYSPVFYPPRKKRTPAKTWAGLLAVSLISTLLGAAVVAFIIFNFLPALRQPLRMSLVDAGVSRPLCPGEEVVSMIETTSEPGLIVDVIMSYTEPSLKRAYLGEEAGIIVQPAGEEAVTYRRPVTWKVPELPPGPYIGLRTYYIRGTTFLPEHVPIPFEIAEDC